MFAILDRVFFLQCACYERRMADGRNLDGAFYRYECARGEQRHPALGSMAVYGR